MAYCSSSYGLFSRLVRYNTRICSRHLSTEVTRRATILDTLLLWFTVKCYTNEADPNEVNWQKKFFGSTDIYNQLKASKINMIHLDYLFANIVSVVTIGHQISIVRKPRIVSNLI